MASTNAAVVLAASGQHDACNSADESGLAQRSSLLASVEQEAAHLVPRRSCVSLAVSGFTALALLLAARTSCQSSASPAPLGDPKLLQLQDADAGGPDLQQLLEEGPPTCPGGLDVPGEGWVNLVNAKVNTPGNVAENVQVDGNAIVVWLGGRTYFGDVCSDESYDSVQYMGLSLLGRSMKWTMDLNGAGCGCNAAVYLVSMPQNMMKSDCGDYYCDANSVCGVQCAEIDLQEANMQSFRATLHVPEDGEGEAAGYGGTGGHKRSWGPADYGPNGECVATTSPFQVEVGFPVDENGALKAMQVILSQEGRPCKIAAIVDSYTFGDQDGIARLSEALAAGMTPAVSYWSDEGMGWLDGSRQDPSGIIEGSCEEDTPANCPEFVKMWDFSIFDGVSQPPATTATTTPLPATPAPAVVAETLAFVPGAEPAGEAAPQPEPGVQPLVPSWNSATMDEATPQPVTPVAGAVEEIIPNFAGAGAGHSGVQTFIPSSTTAPAPPPAADQSQGSAVLQAVGSGPWVQVFRDGQVYFFNQATGVTTWELPAGAAL